MITCLFVCYIITDGVGVQDLLHYDWAEDPPVEEKGPQGEETVRVTTLSFLLSVNGLHWEELGSLSFAFHEVWRRESGFLFETAKRIVRSGLDVCLWWQLLDGAAESCVHYEDLRGPKDRYCFVFKVVLSKLKCAKKDK